MKRIYLVLILFVGVSFGCEDFLEEEVFTVLTPNNFFQNEDDVLVALNGVYDGIQARNLQQVISYTDMVAGSLTWNFGNQYRFLNYEDNFGSIWNNWWRPLYNIVGRANGALEALEVSPLPDDVRLNAEGELRFLRAYAYFYLVRNFANVPLVTQAPATIDDALVLDSAQIANTDSEFYVQRSREDIYDFIIEDLIFAEANLPESYPATLSGKATMGAAAGLLAKVYLQRAGKQLNTVTGVLEDGDPSFWGLAASQCQKVMDLGYELEANFEDVFSEANEIENTEVIFSIKYINSAAIGTDEEGNRIVADNGIVRTGPTPFSFNLNEVPQEFFTFFNDNTEDDDPRRDFTFLTFYVDSNDDTVRWGDTNQFDQVKVRKLLTDLVMGSGGSTSATSAFDYGNDWISLRYADVLLMHSEALNESGGAPTDATIEGINAVRARANRDLITLPITQAELRDAIFVERKLELAYEGQYYYDCQRFGNLVEEINSSYERRGTPSNRHYVFPIPFLAREANPSLVQNFGW